MKKTIAVLLIFLFLVGNYCSLPAYSAKKIHSKISKDRITDSQRIDYVNYDWWKTFNDDILLDYITKGLENNSDLKMMTSATEEYYQAMKIQFANELPQIATGFAPNYVKLPESPMFKTYSWQFALPVVVNYEADIFLKNRDKTKSSKKSYEMSLQDEKAAYISVVSAIATVYFNIVKLDKVIEIQQRLTDNRKKIYDLMVERNHNGLTSEADVIYSEKVYTQAVIEQTEMEKEREKLLHQLAVLIGDSPYNKAEFARSRYEDINFSGSVPSEISTEVITNRPDYQKAEKMVEKAGIDVRVAKKEFLPKINLIGAFVFNSSELGSLFTTANSLMALGGGILAPVFTGGARIANLRLKKASYERVLENYKKTNLTAMQEINDALVVIKCDDDKYSKILQQKQLSEKEYYYNLKKYEAGIISNLDLIQSEESLLSINRLEVSQKVGNYVDYIGLYKAAGAKL